MNRIDAFLLLIAMAVNAVGYSQTTGVVHSKASPTFTYNNKPVTPEAILPFLPGEEGDDTVRPYVVNLRDSDFTCEVEIDSSKYEKWFRCYIECDTMGSSGTIRYEIVRKTKSNNFVLLVQDNGGGTLTVEYVYVLKIIGDELTRVAYYEEHYGEGVKIKAGEIIIGDTHYKIPE